IFNFINECYDVPYINSIIYPYKRLLAKTIRILFCSIIDRNYLLKREDDRRKKNDIKGYDDYLVGFFGYSGLDCFANLSDIKMFKFEDKYFKGPSNANYILEKLYGDYMSLPPVEQRQTHNPLKVIFDLKQIEE
ncbi:MAG: hypothetical protein KBT27_00125, partial [Prevotellaceae bacterium]|nr:hypothetical protein [Candidatus Faecinaster equi]